MVRAGKKLRDRLCLPESDDKALSGLLSSPTHWPGHLAVATLAVRLADLGHVDTALVEPIRIRLE
jgi:hypothetical protein